MLDNTLKNLFYLSLGAGLLLILAGCSGSTLELGFESTPTPTRLAAAPTASPTAPPATTPAATPTATIEVQPTAVVAAPTPTTGVQPTEPPADEKTHYTNEEYGFTLDYSSGWTLQQEETHLVRLGQGPVTFYIGFKWLIESVNIWQRTGLPAGEFQTRGSVSLAEQVVSREVLVYQGHDRAVYYGSTESIRAGDLEFVIFVETMEAGDAAAIPAEVQVEADQIVGSITLTNEGRMQFQIPVVGWYGSVHTAPQGEQGDDYLELLPAGTGRVGLAGADAAVESQIVALRDREPPSQYAHFWGVLTCNGLDYGGCQLLVTQLRPDGPGPLFDPDPVEGWAGTVFTDPSWAQIDDAFALLGSYPIHYGLWSEDEALAAQIEGLRDTGTRLRVWGQVTCGIMDANGCQILVERIEVEGGG